MLRHLLFATACLAAASTAATARPIRLVCQVTSLPSGAHFSRVVIIDPDSHTVHDDALTFQDGATSGLGTDIQQFMRLNDGKAVWGLRRKGADTSVFTVTLDLGQGTYLLQTDASSDHSQGTCWQTGAETS